MIGRPQLGLPIVDPQIDRARGAPAQHDRIKTRELQLGRPEAAGLGVARAAGYRRLATVVQRLWPEIASPVVALRAKVSVFSGPSGSVPRGVCLKR
jgi:hypothetical protein